MSEAKYKEGDKVEYSGLICTVIEVQVNRSRDPWRIEYRIETLSKRQLFVVPEKDLKEHQGELF